MAQLADPRLERFCREYVIDGDGNRSAQAAGYAPGGARQQACKMLKRPEVQARIAELNNRLLRDADITAERVKLELARVAFADLRSLYRADGTLKAPHEIALAFQPNALLISLPPCACAPAARGPAQAAHRARRPGRTRPGRSPARRS